MSGELGMPVWPTPERAELPTQVLNGSKPRGPFDRTIAGGPAHRNLERVLEPGTNKLLGYRTTAAPKKDAGA